MYYSLTFTVNGVVKNTWSDWQMIPNTPPMIPAPEYNTNYVDIPGRSGGPLDLTGIPFNKITYKRMTGTWTFLREPTTSTTRKQLYETLQQYFGAHVGKVVLEEDQTHYYKGRFKVGVPTTSIGPIKFTISFDLEPRRYNVSNDSVDTTYASETI